MSVTITGASDDGVVIGGDIRAEFDFYTNRDDESRVLAFSDGTVLRAVYDDDGIWRFTRVASGSAKFEKEDGVVEEDTNDVATLTGDVRWVVFGKEYAAKK